MEQESTIKKVFKNEVAQIIGIAAAVWFFVTTVIIPINNIQLTQATIQSGIADIKMANADFNTRINKNTQMIAIINNQLHISNK